MPKPPAKQQGELLAAISNKVVAIYADHIGRGPTKARSYLNDSVVTCLLEDTLTRAERKLVESGRKDAVLEVRATFQETMRSELTAAIEELTGRRVRAIRPWPDSAELEARLRQAPAAAGRPCSQAPCRRSKRKLCQRSPFPSSAPGAAPWWGSLSV